jgi:flagellar biosynthesis protein
MAPKTPYSQAVALEYGRHKAPVITAKGDDELARRIVSEAKRQGVYVAEDPRLLAMLSRLDVGQEIPEDMFTAVAVILAWVYWLKGMQPGDERNV